MASKHRVKFTAKKNVAIPEIVAFKKKDGDKVKFDAHKTVKKKVPVSFFAKNK